MKFEDVVKRFTEAKYINLKPVYEIVANEPTYAMFKPYCASETEGASVSINNEVYIHHITFVRVYRDKIEFQIGVSNFHTNLSLPLRIIEHI